MNHQHFARKKRQLKNMAIDLQALMAQKGDAVQEKMEKIISKMRFLLKQLATAISQIQAKQLLGASMVFFGFTLSQNASAQTFAPVVKNPFGWAPANQTDLYLVPSMVDIDNDGDLDMLTSSDTDIRLFENIGTKNNPKFTLEPSYPFGRNNNYVFPTVADIDGDGDFDMFAIQFDDNSYEIKTVFIENTGTKEQSKFERAIVNPFGISNSGYNLYTVFADIDGDGDLDAFTANFLYNSAYETEILFRENIGTKNIPLFSSEQKNPFGLSSTYYYSFPTLADLDDDGDLDLMVTELYGTFNYFENTGTKTNPAFATVVQNPFGINFKNDYYLFATLVDIDGDGDIDILGGEIYGVLQFFENTTIISVGELARDVEISLSPNPTTDILNIQSSEKIKQIDIIDLSGKSLMSEENTVRDLNVSHLKPGLYNVRFTFSDNSSLSKKIEKI